MLHRWMVEAREPDKGVQHWELGFPALCIRADGHRREKRTVIQKLARSIHRCQHLMNKCAELNLESPLCELAWISIV